MLYTTLKDILEFRPCADGLSKLRAGLSVAEEINNAPLSYARIVEINGLDDALWACRVTPQHNNEWRDFAVWCAERPAITPVPPHAGQVDADAANCYAAHVACACVAVLFAAKAARSAVASRVVWLESGGVHTGPGSVPYLYAPYFAAWRAERDAQTKKFLEIVGE